MYIAVQLYNSRSNTIVEGLTWYTGVVDLHVCGIFPTYGHERVTDIYRAHIATHAVLRHLSQLWNRKHIERNPKISTLYLGHSSIVDKCAQFTYAQSIYINIMSPITQSPNV